jgi:autotransporter-associated beta strand protein
MKTTSRRVWRAIVTATTVIGLLGNAAAVTYTWDGDGTPDGSWTNAANWNTAVVPATAADLIFAGAINRDTTNDFSAASNFHNIIFDAGAGAFTLNGNSITIAYLAAPGGVISNASTSLQTINLNVILPATAVRTITGAGDTTIAGVISGADSKLNKNGAGTLTLSGVNTYSGGTTINAGTLKLGMFNALVNTSAVTVAGGSYDLGGFSTVTNGVITMSSGALSNGTLVGASYKFSGGTVYANLAGTGALTNSSGTTLLSGANTYSGGTLISAGTLKLGTLAAAANAGTVMIAGGMYELGGLTAVTNGAITMSSGVLSNGTLVGASYTFSGGTNYAVLAGPGALTNNSGTTTLSSANTFTGGVTLNSGTLNLNNNSALGGTAGSFTINGGTLGNTSGGVRTNLNNNPITINGDFTANVISNSLDLGTGAVSLGTAPGTSRTLTVNGWGLTLGGSVADGDTANSLIKAGGGTLALAGANTYTGPTLITAGTLQLGNGGTSGSLLPGSALTNNGTLAFNRSNAITQGVHFASVIVGSGAVTKLGAGTLVLTGANSYTGLTTISEGVLNLQNATALGATDAGATVANNARLELQGGITVAGEALTITGQGGAAFYNGALNSKSGSNTWAGPITLGGTSTRIGAEAGATLHVSGPIDSGGNNYGVIFRPGDMTATVMVSGVNTYVGDTTILGGLVQLAGGDDRLPTGTKLRFGANNVSGSLDLNGCNQEVAGLTVVSGTVNFLTNSAAAASTLTVYTSNGAPSTFSGKLGGNLALTKAGADVLTLSGVNSYSGGTTISGGTLALSGSGTPGNGTLDIRSGASFDVSATTAGSYTLATARSLTNSGTLTGGLIIGAGASVSGGGLFTGAVTNQSGGYLTPGEGGHTNFFYQGLTLAGGSTNSFWIGSAATHDMSSVSNSLTYTGDGSLMPQLQLNLTSYTWSSGDQMLLYDNLFSGLSDFDGTNRWFTVNDAFGNTTNLLNGALFSAVTAGSATNLFSLRYDVGTGNDIMLTAIPEPASINLLLLLGAACWMRRRLHRPHRRWQA